MTKSFDDLIEIPRVVWEALCVELQDLRTWRDACITKRDNKVPRVAEASRWLEQGYNAFDVAARLGYASPDRMLDEVLDWRRACRTA